MPNTINSWTLLGKVYINGRWMYLVRCVCGYEGTRRVDQVDSGRTVSCRSCASRTTLVAYPNKLFAKRPHSGEGDITRTFWNAIVNNAAVRDIPFDITIEYAWELFQKQEAKCALSGVSITLSSVLKHSNPDYSTFTASLDRIDSSLGYIEGNVQWVHKAVNRLKGCMAEEELVFWCSRIAAQKALETGAGILL